MTQQHPEGEAFKQPIPWYARNSTLHSLRYTDWSFLWLMGLFWHLNLWMEYLVLGWLTLEITNSPFQVALVAGLRIVPMGFFGLIFGSLGDRFPKRNVLVVAQIISICASVGLAVILLFGVVEMWHIYVATTLGGFAFAAYLPVRRALLRDLLPEGAVVNAIYIDTASFMGMSMVGRFLAGGLLEFIGPGGTFVVITLSYVAGLLLLFAVPNKRPVPVISPQEESLIQVVKQGLSHALGSPVLKGVLIITFVVNALVYSSTQLAPVFAKDVLDIGPGLLGLMSGMEGAGALIGALVLASLSKRLGPVFIIGAFILSISIFFFGWSNIFILSTALLFISGFGSAAFVAMQAAIPAAAAGVQMRARAMGAVSVAMGWGTPLGMIYVGILAETIGPQRAVEINAAIAIIVLLVALLFMPALRKFSGS